MTALMRMRRLGSASVQPMGLADLVDARMYFISLHERSVTEANTPRAMTSRSILPNQI